MQQKKFRKERGLFIVEGLKTVQELLLSDYRVRDIYSSEAIDLEGNLDSIELITPKELARISSLKNPNIVLAVAEIPDSKPIDHGQSLILLLDGIRDPGNLGTIIRTAKWFGINTIVCSEDCADIHNSKVVQSTMGALFHVNVIYQNLEKPIEILKEKGVVIIGAMMNGESIYSLDHSKKTALIVGSESHGISTSVGELCDRQVTIPNKESYRHVESLNAAIATSILLSELTR